MVTRESGGSQSSHHIITVWLKQFLLSLTATQRVTMWRNGKEWGIRGVRLKIGALKSAIFGDSRGYANTDTHICIHKQISTDIVYVCRDNRKEHAHKDTKP